MVGSQRAYAKHRKEQTLSGGSLAAVQKAIKSDRIKLTPSGQIDFDQADRDWECNSNKRQQRPAKPKAERTSSRPRRKRRDPNSFLEAQRKREWIRVQKEEFELGRRRAEFAQIKDFEDIWAEIVLGARKRLLEVPGKLAHRIAVIIDPKECEELIKREIVEALTALKEFRANAA